MNQQTPDSRPDLANAARGLRHVFVNRLAVEASIGIHPHEKQAKQTIWLTIDAGVMEDKATPEAIGDVVCYEDMCKVATALAASRFATSRPQKWIRLEILHWMALTRRLETEN